MLAEKLMLLYISFMCFPIMAISVPVAVSAKAEEEENREEKVEGI